MSDKPKRILGIDPGLNITGYGVIDYWLNGDLELVEAGILRAGSARKDLGDRLMALRDGLSEVIAQLSPNIAAMEELYSHYDRPKTAILMGHARGVLCMTAANGCIPVKHYSATQIKKVVTGNGRAPKIQMQQAVARLLQLETPPEPPDVADALAVAICHSYLSEKRVLPA